MMYLVPAKKPSVVCTWLYVLCFVVVDLKEIDAGLRRVHSVKLGLLLIFLSS